MILRNNEIYTSYSQLNRFINCPFSWQLRYIDGIKEEGKSKHLDYGNIIHLTLEFIYDFAQSFDEKPPLSDTQDFFEEKVLELDLQCDTEEEFNDWIDKGLDMIDSVYSNEGIYELIRDSEIVGVELPFRVQVETPMREYTNKDGEFLESDTVTIVGFIDLVLKTDEGYVVIDHKSGGRKFDKKKLRTDLQLPIYGKAIFEMFGEYPVYGYYNMTRLGLAQRVIYTERVTLEMNEIMDKRSPKDIYCLDPIDAMQQVRQLFTEMYQKTHKGTPSFLCGFCDYKEMCSYVKSGFKKY